MAEFKLLKNVVGLARVSDISMIESSRVWICTECGARVFHCKSVAYPDYPCLCGGKNWRPRTVK
jgi:hypothetical protein